MVNSPRLLQYINARLFGFRSSNGAALAADPMLGFNTKTDMEAHRELEVLGKDYTERLGQVLRRAAELGLVGDVEASADFVHIPHWGQSKVGEWGKPWSTMMNRAFPGLYPLSVYDLDSSIFLSFTEFVQKPPGEPIRPGEQTCGEVMEALHLLERSGLRVRSVRGDRLITSVSLMRRLGKAGKRYYFTLKSNSVLRRWAEEMPEAGWIDVGRGDMVAKRGVDYHGLKSNLVVLRKGSGRRYMFISNDDREAPTILGEYRRRGLHEKGLGGLNKVGFKSLPSRDLDRIAGHALMYVFLGLTLALMRRELGLGNLELSTLGLLLSKPGVVRHDPDGLRVWMVVNRSLLKRLGRSTIRWREGVIRLIELRLGRPRKNYGQSTN